MAQTKRGEAKMAERVVHFATNRAQAEGRFPAECGVPVTQLVFGTAAVAVVDDPLQDGVASAAVASGVADPGSPAGLAAAAAMLAPWLAAARARAAVPLLMVHGFDYSFADACARAGDFATQMEAATGLRLEPLAFAWPSSGQTELGAYAVDQGLCQQSGPALAGLIRAVAATAGGRKPAYLAHSMGARATRCAMEALVADGGVPPRAFGQAIVIAGDEDTDVLEAHGTMRPLLDLADWTSIGIYPSDGTLTEISTKVTNHRARLGAAGPLTTPAAATRCFVVDYGEAVDIFKPKAGKTDLNYIGHQYYRNDPRVMADLAAALGGDTPPNEVPGRRLGEPNPSIGSPEIAGRLYVRSDTASAPEPLLERGALSG
jgi:esterase/lipase superfamily enzyme